jgi:hypothetical protein
MKNNNTRNVHQPLKNVNIIVMVLLSIFSLGFYMGVWMLNRKNDIQQLSMRNHISFGLWRLFTVGLFLFLSLNILKNFIFTEYGFLLIDSYDTIFTFFFIGLVNYSAFRLVELLEKKTDMKFNKVLLTFYIQFKVNKEYKNTDILE